MRIKTKLLALTFMLVLTAGTSTASIIADKPPKERTRELTEEQKSRVEALKRRGMRFNKCKHPQ
jgi:hypothetical protein